MESPLPMPSGNQKGQSVGLSDVVYDEEKHQTTKDVHEYEFVLLSPDEFDKEREDYRIPSPDTFHGDSKGTKQYLSCCKFPTAATGSLSMPGSNGDDPAVFDSDPSPALEFGDKANSPSKCSDNESMSDTVCETSKVVLPNVGDSLLGTLHALPHGDQLTERNAAGCPSSETALTEASRRENTKTEEKGSMSRMKYDISVPEYALDGTQNRFIQVTLLNGLESGSCGIGEPLIGNGQVLTIPKLYSCLWVNCNTHFLSIDDLSNHVATSHIKPPKDQVYLCMWKDCIREGKGFNARYKMMSHIRTHTGEKPHVCMVDSCDKSFTRLENLKIHMRTHTGEKPYKCPYEGCTKSYANSSDRFKHTKTHYNKKPFHCKFPGCDKSYTDPSSLRKHSKSHSK